MDDALDSPAHTLAQGLKRLTHNGGPGDQRTARLGRDVVTVVDVLERALAKRVVDAAELRTGRPLQEIPLVAMLADVDQRTGGNRALADRVFAEVGRLRNAAEGVR